MTDDKQDKWIAIHNELRMIEETLAENQNETRNLNEIEALTHQIKQEKQQIFEELAHFWKGTKTNHFIQDSWEETEQAYRLTRQHIDAALLQLQQTRKNLLKTEEHLLAQQATFTHENDEKEPFSCL